MENIIQRFTVPPLSKAQQFVVNLLCGIVLPLKIIALLFLRDKNKVVVTVKEYYEQKSGKNWKRIDRLEDENNSLIEENKLLKAQISGLQRQKDFLIGKLKATSNMMRILTKTKEDTSSCKTPVKIDVSDVDCLLRKKLTGPTVGAKNQKNFHTKSQPVKVVQKKDVKKIAMPKGKENVSCSKIPLLKDAHKPTRNFASKSALTLPLKRQTKIVPKKPSPMKSVIVYKGKESLGGSSSSSATLRIVTKTAAGAARKIEQKNILISSKSTTKRAEPKNNDSKTEKNLNQTFIVNCQTRL